MDIITSALIWLLLGVVLTTQAQDCDTPVYGTEMILRDEYILQTSFPDGSTVSFACSVGHTGGGPSSITCTAGIWSPIRLKCERKNCGAFEEIANGEIDYSGGTEFGDKIVVTCKKGFNLVGIRNEFLCRDSGWDGRAPTCERIPCDAPPVISSGSYSPIKEDYRFGDVIKYMCQKPYTRNGTSERVCSDTGEFTSDAPLCVLVKCGEPVVTNGTWAGGARPPYGHRAAVTLQCNRGFVMEGEPQQTCDINSKWSPGLPVCKMSPTPPSTTSTTTTTAVPSGPSTVPPPAPTSDGSIPVTSYVIPIVCIAIIGIGAGIWAYMKKPGSRTQPKEAPTAAEEDVPLA